MWECLRHWRCLSSDANDRQLLQKFKVIGLFVATLYGRIVFGLNLKAGGVDWAQYKKDVAAHSDYWKYDDVLRFVIDVSPEQKEKS